MMNGYSGNKTVIGSYAGRDQALEVVNRLRSEGYTRNDITLYANPETSGTLYNSPRVGAGPGNFSRTGNEVHVGDKLADAFSVVSQEEDFSKEHDFLLPFQPSLKAGKIVVAVDNYRGMTQDTKNAATIEGTGLNGVPARHKPDNYLDTSLRTTHGPHFPE